MRYIPVFLLFLGFVLSGVEKGYAQEEDPTFSIGLRAGYYKPSLRTFNRVIGDKFLSILQDPTFLLPRNPEFLADCTITLGECAFRSIPTPGVGGNATYGVDLTYRISEKFSVIASLQVYQASTVARDKVTLLIRQDQRLRDVPREARYNLEINEYFLSGRYHFLNEPRKRTLYFDVGLLGIAEATLTMDALMKVLSTEEIQVPNGGFTSVSSTEASGLGFVIRFGIGGEYYLTRWFSVGIQAEYILGDIPRLQIARVFTAGFQEVQEQPPEALIQTPVQLPTPQNPPEVGEYVQYGPIENFSANREVVFTSPQNLPIELDGLGISALFRIHF